MKKLLTENGRKEKEQVLKNNENKEKMSEEENRDQSIDDKPQSTDKNNAAELQTKNYKLKWKYINTHTT